MFEQIDEIPSKDRNTVDIEPTIKIKVKTPDGQVVDINVNTTKTIAIIRTSIKISTDYVFYWKGKILAEDQTFIRAGIVEGD